ncbi:MAG TPA: hypothetical protein VFC29_05130 [Candidatus Limnocylindrales bacterium]|nr:hypothetical protein [Candidatus Limnocylindrales bacterium]
MLHVVFNRGSHGDRSQLCRAIGVDVEPQSSEQVLQLFAVFGIIFDEADGFLPLA